MAVVRWLFFDPVESETYEMEVNPNAGGSPEYKKTIGFTPTSAPNGKALIFEGQDEPQKIQWSGVILTKEHYDAYVTWWGKRRQIRLTDDLDRSYWIYLESFTPTRVRAATRPWKHNFEVVATILDWAT